MKSCFYDTCIFLLAQNEEDADHDYCVQLIDTQIIAWPVVFSEISRAEGKMPEFLTEFVKQCALQGIACQEVPMDEIKATRKANQDASRKLQRLGLSGRDAKQILAASSAEARVFASRDADFLAPERKRRPRGSARAGGEVASAVKEHFAVDVHFPDSALAVLRG